MTVHSNGACPICKLKKQKVEAFEDGGMFSMECVRCGKFIITRTAKSLAEKKDISYKLIAWIREFTELGSEVPEINSKNLKEIEATLPSYRVLEKQLLLLRAFEKKALIIVSAT